MTKGDFGWDDEMDRAPRMKSGVVGEMTSLQATNLLQDKLDRLEEMRKDLARGYGAVPAKDIVMEYEVGESLTVVRKAIKRIREALGKVSQLQLPMN